MITSVNLTISPPTMLASPTFPWNRPNQVESYQQQKRKRNYTTKLMRQASILPSSRAQNLTIVWSKELRNGPMNHHLHRNLMKYPALLIVTQRFPSQFWMTYILPRLAKESRGHPVWLTVIPPSTRGREILAQKVFLNICLKYLILKTKIKHIAFTPRTDSTNWRTTTKSF